MKSNFRGAFFIVFALSGLTIHSLHAESFLQTAQTMWLNLEDSTKVNILADFHGIPAKQSADLIAKITGGKVVEQSVAEKGPIQAISKSGEVSFTERKNVEYRIEGGRLGSLTIKPVLNAAGARNGFQLVATSVGLSDTKQLQEVAESLQKAGAHGSTATSPMTLRVQIPISEKGEALSTLLTNLARNFANPSHVAQMQASGKMPQFAVQFSSKMQEKLMDGTYEPTLQGLYSDAIVRQTLENLGRSDVWKMTDEQAKKAVFEYNPNEITKALEKNPAVKILAPLANAFPNEPLSQIMKSQNGFSQAGATIEFRNTADLVSPTKQALGVVSVTRKHGGIDHDRYVTAQSGIVESTLADLRRDQAQLAKTGRPLNFRYFLADPRKPLPTDGATDFAFALPYYQGVSLGVMPADLTGHKPVVLEGESVVFHNRTFHQNNIMGTYNPGIQNSTIAQMLTDNKFAEARFFNKYKPGSVPETNLLNFFGTKEGDLDAVIEKLNKRYPEGWVIKAIKEQNTGKFLVHNGRDLKKLLQGYRNGDFEKYKQKVDHDFKGRDLDEIFEEYQKHPDFLGWKISEYLKHPDLSIVQKKVPILKEFRVEALGGKILSNGSTIDRHFYKELDPDEPFKYPKQDEAIIAKVEAFGQSVLDSLPEKLRSTPFAFDIAYLKDGTCVIIESNPGPESGFLTEWPPSINALHKFMRDYPRLVKEGKISNLSLTEQEQVDYMKARMKEWGIDPKVQFSDFVFTEKAISKKSDRPKEGPEYYTIGKPRESKCAADFIRLAEEISAR